MEGVEDIPGAALSEGIQWDWETLPRVPRRARPRAAGARRRHAGAARRGARLRDGRARRQERARDRRRHRGDGRASCARASRPARSASRRQPHDRAHGDRRRAGARHVRRRGRAVRHRPRARRARHRRVRARAGGRARRGPRRARARDGLDAPARRPRSAGRSRSRSRRTTTTPSRGGACSTCAREAAAEGAQVRPQVAGPPGRACCSGSRPSTRSRTARRGRRSAVLPLAEQVARDARPRAAARGSSPRSTPRSRRCAQFLDPERVVPARRRARLRARAASTASPRIARAAGPRPRWTCSTTCCSRTTAARSCCGRCSTTPTSTSTPCARCSLHPTSAWGLGDGGAHCGTTCDASTPTFMLTHWARDRDHDRLPLELVVQKMTARHRRAVRPRRPRRARAGHARRRQRHRLRRAAARTRPSMVHDLPGDARRFVQGSRGLRRDRQARGHRSCATARTRARARVSSCATCSPSK